GSGKLRLGNALHHADLHPSRFRALERHFVHEGAHQEDAAPVGLQKIFWCQGIGDCHRVETAAFVAHQDGDAWSPAVLERGEFDVHSLLDVVAVAVFDRVDDRFAHGHRDPVHGIVIKADGSRDVLTYHLHEVEHPKRAVEVDTDGVAAGHRVGSEL